MNSLSSSTLHQNLPSHSIITSSQLGVPAHSLYKWLWEIKPDNSEQHAHDLLEARSEILKLISLLKRNEEERDILKKAVRYFARDPD